jgi:hypothetical protein
MVSLNFTLAGKTFTSTNITFTSSDPSRLLLSADAQTPGQASITIKQTYNSGAIAVQGLGSSGTVTVTAVSDVFGSAQTAVTLTPAGLAWAEPSATLPIASGSSAPIVSAYSLNPSNLTTVVSQQVRPGITGSVTFQNSNPAAVTLTQSSIPLSSFTIGSFSGSSLAVPMTVNGGGTAAISIVQPPGFVQPTGSVPLSVTALLPSIQISPGTVGQNMQGVLFLQLINAPGQTAKAPVTLTSGDPSKLLLATNSSDIGFPSIVVVPQNGTYPNVYMNGIQGPSDVKISAIGPGLADSSAIAQVFSTAIAFGAPYYGGPSTLSGNTQQASLTSNVQAVVLGSNSNNSTITVLRPGIGPIYLTINSSNPAVASVVKSPILNSLTSGASFQITPLTGGQTTLSIVVPPGFVTAPTSQNPTQLVTITGPTFNISDLALGQDLQTSVTMTVQNGASTIPNDVDVTLTSGDPTNLLLSASGTSVGAAALTVHFAKSSAPSTKIYLQALGSSGVISLTIAANGYGSTTTKVTLVPTTFATDYSNYYFSIPQTNSVVQIQPVPKGTSASFFFSNFQFRPGFAGMSMAVASSNANATVSPSTLTWSAGAATMSVNVQGITPGTATVTFTVPAPYLAPANVTLNITGGNLFVYTTNLTLGQNLQTSINTTGPANSATLTVTSSDPTRVLVAASQTAVGQASVNITNPVNGYFTVYVQALGNSGTVPLTFSSAGFNSATSQIQLAQTEVVLSNNQQTPSLTTISPAITFQAQLTASVTYQSSTLVLRPGASPLNVPINLSDNTVGTVNPAQLTFNPGDTTKSFTFQPVAAGSTLLSLGVPSGFADPGSQRQQLLTVVAPRVVFNTPLTVGNNLVRPTALTITTGPVQAITVTLTSADPTRLLLANTANPGGVAALTVTFQAGVTVSSSFSLIGLASSGTVNLQLTGPPLAAATFSVNLEPSGFEVSVLQSTATVGSFDTFTIQSYALNPQTLAPDIMMPLRPGVPAVAVNLISGNTAIFSTPGAVSFSPGDSQHSVTLVAQSAGTVTLTVPAPAGFATPSSGASVVIKVN